MFVILSDEVVPRSGTTEESRDPYSGRISAVVPHPVGTSRPFLYRGPSTAFGRIATATGLTPLRMTEREGAPATFGR
jgi:hypothetical protein